MNIEDSFSVENLILLPEFSEWFGLWLGDGDRSLKRGTFGVSNQSIDTQLFNTSILKNVFKFPESKIRVEITTSSTQDDEYVKNKWSKILGIPINSFKTISRNPIAKKDCLRVFVYSMNALRYLLDNTEKIRKLVLSSNREIRAAFINGIFAAEGSVRKKGKNIRLNMKDFKEVDFVKKVLESLEIRSSISFNPCNHAHELLICGYENFLKFRDIDGFGKHKEKNALLEEQIQNYGKLPWSYRFKQIEDIFKNKKEITCSEFAGMLNLDLCNSRFILRKFKNEGKLKIAKKEKTGIKSYAMS